MGSMRIDLHTHSLVSDGTDTPAELVHTAARAGLDVVALTDHDTTAGWAAATEALPPGLTLVPGAELSCVSEHDGERGISVHLLAYLFDPDSPAIIEEQRRLRDARRRRLRAIAARMADDGLPVDPEEILGLLPPDSPAGRPHLAQALVRAGLVSTVDQAFAEYLGNGHGYLVPRQDTPVGDAIRMIAAAGGVTVFAHPFARSRGRVVSADTIAELAEQGLTGLEVDHPNHDERTRAELRGLARELDLVQTGSSDYHGTNKTTPIGAETTDPEAFEALVAKASGAQLAVG
ncbi:PHP domain-containing protein [Amycolatopsis cynarae]|uniref:PHP domain-containing protein n=1 Tax=Amycolatopsis cynarae TaxID=2995223 RepID=A0ABY7B0V6_9PSEU|nr:PHP domain-containing protein [Amycolatopsis sp. HUAS 11-8]WAL64852.1 PHP domain-containing protein [Amycolatopsis sp. HUAS 11-8]